jgi:hypothetical protein
MKEEKRPSFPSEETVIPAPAGIQWSTSVLDSRLRGKDVVRGNDAIDSLASSIRVSSVADYLFFSPSFLRVHCGLLFQTCLIRAFSAFIRGPLSAYSAFARRPWRGVY